MSGLEALRASLQENIERFDNESTKHKQIHRKYQTIIIVLIALTTATSGLSLVLTDWSRLVQFGVLCLTAATSAISSWSEMRKARELWQHEREVYYALLDIQRGMEFAAANRELAQTELESIFQRMAAVLGSSSQKWARIHEKKDS